MAASPFAPTFAHAVRPPTVAAGYVRGLLDFAVARGADRAILLAESLVPVADLDDPDRRVPLARYVALMRAAKQLTHDPALALHYGEAVPLAETSVVGLFGQASATAMDAFIQLNRYARLIIDFGQADAGDRFRLEHKGEDLWLVDSWARPEEFQEFAETAFASMISWARGFGDGGVRAVHFQHAAPGHSAEYHRVFRVPVVFSSDRNALLIEPAVVNTRVARLPRYALGLVSDRADALLANLQQSASIRSKVEACLIRGLHTGSADMGSVARSLGMSRATLTRRLAAEGATFTMVLDELRRRLASDYLEKVAVQEAAYLLGFSDPAAFSRAFKRWTGRTAREARANRTGAAST